MRTVLDRTNWSGVNRRMVDHFIAVQAPITLMFLFLTLRSILSSGAQQYLIGGSFIVVCAIILGRYQYIRYVLLGDYFKAYSNPLEWLVLFLGLLGYTMMQQFQVHIFQGSSFNVYMSSTFLISSNSTIIIFLYWAIIIVDFVLLVNQHRMFKAKGLSSKLLEKLYRAHIFAVLGYVFRFSMVIGITVGHFQVYRLSAIFIVLFLTFVFILLVQIKAEELPEWYNTNYEIQQQINIKWEKILSTLSRQKLYLIPGLTAEELSTQLNIELPTLRDVIRQKTELTIPTFLNIMRLEEFLKRAHNHELIDIEFLLLEVGYMSKSTLERTAKRVLNEAPSSLVANKVLFDIRTIVNT